MTRCVTRNIKRKVKETKSFFFLNQINSRTFSHTQGAVGRTIITMFTPLSENETSYSI